MRKNRKMPKKMSVVAANTMRFGAILFVFFVMVILNRLASSNCSELKRAKGVLEAKLVKLEDSRQRESIRWEQMTTPDKLQLALTRNGLKMVMPHPEQSVRMRPNGTPVPGQLALNRAARRRQDRTVSYSGRATKRKVR